MTDKAERAVEHILRRIKDDGRLAYLIGPYSEGYDLLTEAYAESNHLDVEMFRLDFEKLLKPTPCR